MSIASFSANGLDRMLSEVSSCDTVGLSTLRDIVAFARAVTGEVDDPARRVLAWVLMMQMDRAADRFDGDPMTVDDSAQLVEHLRTVVREALLFLMHPAVGNDSATAVSLATRLIELVP